MACMVFITLALDTNDAATNRQFIASLARLGISAGQRSGSLQAAAADNDDDGWLHSDCKPA